MGGLRLLSVEGFRFDASVSALAAHVDLELGAGLGELGGHVCHSDPGLEARRERPARDNARVLIAMTDRVPLTRDARTREHERRQLLLCPLLARRRDGLRADEARLLLAAPAKTRLDRVAAFVHVVAVEVEADLEAKGVARSQAGRARAGLQERGPHGGRAVRRDEQLHPILARVAGAAYE